ncbi:MAG: hypothetical protein ACI4MJ_07115 [Aristaeellaceae bacterium]
MLDTAIAFLYDMDRGIRRTALPLSLLTGDKHAHTFMGKVVNRGENYPLHGASVSAYFIRADGVTVPITGTVQDNDILVKLPESCYRVAGRFQLVIKLAVSDQIITVFWGDGVVSASQTDSLLDEEGVVPSLDALLAQIAATEAAAASATGAASSATTAANRANSAASAMDGMTATASTLPTGSAATVSVEKVSGGFVLDFGLPRGEKGEKGDTGEPGKDGTGSVSSVNGIESVQGDVTLTASDVGALPEDGTAVDAGKLGGKAPGCYLAPYNWLDNSDFLHPVNQRGVSGTISAAGYFLDRWKLVSGSVTVSDAGLVLNGSMAQVLEFTPSGTVTVAASAGTAAYDAGTKTFTLTGSGVTITWAALYEGAYTAGAMPAYRPRGYVQEQAVCQRYYQRIGGGSANAQPCYAMGETATTANTALPLKQLMRSNMPALTLTGTLYLRKGTADKEVTSITLRHALSGILYAVMTADGLTAGDMYVLRLVDGAMLELSAEL